MNAPEVFELQMSRHIRAPRERVCDAFLSAAELQMWMCPRGMSVAESHADARIGGRWGVTMLARDGSRFTVGGEYREIARPQRVAFTWQWDGGPMPGVQTLVEATFTEQDGDTLVQVRHSGFPAATVRDGHRQGWNGTLSRLTERLDPRGTAATLTILGDARSTYTRTVLMALAEKGIAATLQQCAPHAPEILAVHPFGRIPALRDGEFGLFETSAIVRYIEECFGGPSLLPGTIADRARCEQWVSATNAYLYDTLVRRFVLQYVFPRGEGGRPDAAVIAGALKEIPAQLAALDAACARSDYLAGPAVSMADLFIAPILAYVERTPEGQTLLAAAPHLMRLQAKLRERPSFAATEPPRS